MKRLAYPVMLISLSLLAAALVTTILAKTIASFESPEDLTPMTEMAAR